MCEGLALAVSRRTQAECERDILVKRCQESEEALKHIEVLTLFVHFDIWFCDLSIVPCV